jgi:hypothetical protein
MAGRLQPVVLEGRRILFRNFAGEEGRFNAKGNRNFNVVLEPEEAEAMEKDGWNVKYLQPREEEDQPLPRLEVTVKFGKVPPRVILITSRGKTALDEDMVKLLDWAEIENVDLIVRPYEWTVNEKSGVKAYLKSIYVTIREDELEKKYMDVPDSAAESIVASAEEGPPWEE